MKQKIVIIGSYNVGLFLSGASIPRVGETLIGDSFYEGGGGKGSNQAVAAAILGADVAFAGRIGADKYGKDALAMYERLGVSGEHMITDEGIHSGISVILVDEKGNNSIMVVPGANARLSRSDIDSLRGLLEKSKFAGFQLENSLDTVLYGIKAAHAAGAETLLDPAPAQPLPEDIYPFIDYIKPNEHEAATLTGMPVTDYASALQAGRWFLSRGVKHAVITLGGGGAVLTDTEGEFVYSAPKIDMPVIDTTGAGDCFSGALLCRLAEGWQVRDAIPFALCAATLSTAKRGVIESLPGIEETMALYALQGGKLMRPAELGEKP